MSTDRIAAILDAAYVCFTRHGVRRTTMDDIAREAGVSRAAVYQYVRNKDDAYRQLAAVLFERSLAEASTAASAPVGLTERVHGVVATKLELTLRLWRDSPHAAELLDASAKLTGDLVDRHTRELVDLLTDVLRPGVGRRARSSAEIVMALARGVETDLLDHNRSRRRLREGVALLIAGLTTGMDAQT